jgi:AcrR family transcriptional regulator
MAARKAVEQELSRERILEVARDLFATQGYRSVSMRKIAGELGYSHGSLYYHFKQKAELFYALVSEDFNMLLNLLRTTLEHSENNQGDTDILKQMMLRFIKFGLDHRHHYEIMFLIRDSELRHYSRVQQALCMDLFSSVVYQAITGIPGAEAKRFTLPWNLFMSVHGFITYSIRFEQTYEEVKKLSEEHVNFLCQSIHKLS